MSSIASGGSSSADSCSNGHTFIYAGNNYEMPDGWPCQCRKTGWNKPSVTNDPNWPPSHEQLLKNMGNTTNDTEQKYGEHKFTPLDPEHPFSKQWAADAAAMPVTNDPAVPYTENTGLSGLTVKRLQELCDDTGMVPPSGAEFTERELVRRVVEALIADGTLVHKEQYDNAVRMWQEMHPSFERSRDEELAWKRQLDDGTLIRRDELLIELMARKQAADMAFSERADERHSVVKICIQNIIDHLKKPA